jgi:hypothetical protein
MTEQLRQQLLESRFFQDMETPLNINGQESNRATWNLIMSIRDVKLFTKGMIITRGWRLKDVKDYFNIKGNKHKVLEQLETIKAFFQE